MQPDHMVSQWPDASPLGAVLAEGGEAVRPLLEQILREALQTLATLHAHGLVHGNISQDNLRVSIADGTIWLTDVAADATAPAYPAPELAPGQPFPPTADIFALGKLIEDAARQAGTTPPAIIKWMVLPKIYRATAADLVEALGLGLRPTSPVPAEPVAAASIWDAPAPPDPNAPPREKKAPRSVSWEEFNAEKKAEAAERAKPAPVQEETKLIPDPSLRKG
jgi:serine/threonine protein kinase